VSRSGLVLELGHRMSLSSRVVRWLGVRLAVTEEALVPHAGVWPPRAPRRRIPRRASRSDSAKNASKAGQRCELSDHPADADHFGGKTFIGAGAVVLRVRPLRGPRRLPPLPRRLDEEPAAVGDERAVAQNVVVHAA
jgi:hypothetical protein